MNRLTAKAAGEEETCYLYDLCGNRLEKRKGGRTERYRYSRKNQLTRWETEEGVWDYTFDPQGNLTGETGPVGERQYLYDAANRQIRILAGGKETQANRYDGEGLRAGVTVNGKSATFLYADGNLYGELDEGGRLTSRYIRGAGLAGLEYQGRLYGIHRDEQLSTGWITGKNGTPENAYEYDGILFGSYGNIPCRLLYSSQQYDGETEQYYLRARYYNPVIGRFMQEDAYRGDGLNLYAYCANNPVMYYDPSGESSDCNHGADVEKNAQKENVTGEGGGDTREELIGNNWSFSSEKDVDFRGMDKTYRDAIDEAFKRTGVPKESFEVTQWGKDPYGKSIPVEWKPKKGIEGVGGAAVNMDIPEWNNIKSDGTLGEGSSQPHIGYQNAGKGKDRVRGHIFVDDVPATRR